jgi:hypothetical protein
MSPARRPPSRPGIPLRLLALAGLGALTLSACGASEYHYVKNSAENTYFKVPSDWKLFDADAVLDASGEDLSRSERSAQLEANWRVAYDAAPSPSLKHVGKLAKSYPTGFAQVRDLSASEADVVSEQWLRNVAIDLDTELENDTVAVESYESFQLDGGFRGLRFVVDIELSSGQHVRVNQVAAVDQANSKLYLLFQACTAKCYAKNEAKIETVADSWTVRD